MATTQKRISINLTKGMKDQLEELCKHFGENQTQVFNRCLQNLHNSLTLNTIKLSNTK